ncbi:transcription termination factor MTEF1, chloroplastic-like [Typha latifolia]|uniref:transcription termination factor MTEF1, chloroplastic-like n=1 Tax=Typha latifolia TaxID=4733 RepID=UPI003C2DA8A6
MLLRLHLSPPLPLPPPPRKPPQNPKPNRTSISLPVLSSPIPSSSSSTDAGLLFREKLLFLSNDLKLDTSRALSLNPSLRSAPLSSLLSSFSLLLSFGLLPSDATRVFSFYPHLLTSDPSPVFHFLLGPADIPFPDLRVAVVRCPRLLVSPVESQLLPALYFLRRFGFVGRHRITANTSLLLVSSVERTLIPKLEFLQGLGFSSRETRSMVLRSPGLLTFSIEKNFRPKVEFLVGEMRREVAELKEFPQYFSFSLEGRIKPRHRMLKESGCEMSLAKMLRISDGEFRDRLMEMRLAVLDKKL